MKYFLFIIPCLFLACLTSPEFNRTNVFDKDSGIPNVTNLQYRLNSGGIFIAWVDGSNHNDEFILTQKIYDQSDSGTDSLIITKTFGPDEVLTQQNRGQFGFPYEIIVTSVRYKDNSNEVKLSRSDSIFVNFGTISFFTKRFVGDSFRINWRNSSISRFVENVSVELNQGNGWNQVALLEKYEGQFSYPSNELNTSDQFRVGLTIPNFNGRSSRVSEFIVTVD